MYHYTLQTRRRRRRFTSGVFDMVEVGRTDSKFAEGIFLSDGTINLSVVRFKTKEAADRGDGLGSAFGLHHFGFWVENEDETRGKLREAGAEYLFTVDRPDYFEEKYKGPDAVMVDISGSGWVGAETVIGVEQGRHSEFLRPNLSLQTNA
jgi:catechol 2,3-dioxygenase-like lactoylglutathione lyase family enzyme